VERQIEPARESLGASMKATNNTADRTSQLRPRDGDAFKTIEFMTISFDF
jgi:hypothetical protein